MKFIYKETKQKNITDKIILTEYCANVSNLSVDGAYATIDGPYGPKINKNFTELFFVISGRLKVEMNDTIYEMLEKDLFIILPGVKHKILGDTCEVFIACSPQFNAQQVDLCE
jgi:mannose-6-phosphate isomerase-like protein (cupin superfamily)